MGIYVPFLKKMPSRCEGCPIIDGTGCRARNPYYMDETGITRPKNCPLIELPEKHGRLIDADALMGKVNNAKLLQPEIADVYVDDYIIVRDWLHSAPTILEEEVKE